MVHFMNFQPFISISIRDFISCKQNIIGSITFHNNKHDVLDTHIITFAGDQRSEPPHHCRHLRPCLQSPVVPHKIEI